MEARLEVRWPARVGSWLAIGATPVAVFAGAEIVRAFDSLPDFGTLALAGLVAMGMLLMVGVRGLVPPTGEGTSLAKFLPRYVNRSTSIVISSLLAVVMVGWTSYYLGLGAGAVEGFSGVPRVWFLIPLAALGVIATYRGVSRWNAIAVGLGLVFLICAIVIAVRLAPGGISVGTVPSIPMLSGTLVAFVGYVAVFSLRAPDFSVGLYRVRDLVICASFLVVPAAILMFVGAVAQGALGEQRVEQWLGESVGGSLLLLGAVIAPVFSALHTGTLAASAVIPRTAPAALAGILATVSVAIAVFRIEETTLAWLSVLAAVLPPVIVPLAWESWARKRGRSPHIIPSWTWAPGALLGVVTAMVGQAYAAFLSIGVALLVTAVWRRQTSRP